MELAGRTALVTGASAGIGAAVARLLALAGCHVLAQGRDPVRTARLAESIGARPIVADLSTPVGVEGLVAAAQDGVDLLVAAAGRGWSGPLPQIPTEEVEDLVALNLVAPMLLTRAVVPGMVSRGGGRVVLITSVAGRTGVAGEAVYAATKAGLDAFAESLRLELVGAGVGVTTVVPAAVATGFFTSRGRAYDRRVPRLRSPEQVARAVVGAVSADVDEVHVPRWVRSGEVVRAVAPRAYRALAARFGEDARIVRQEGRR